MVLSNVPVKIPSLAHVSALAASFATGYALTSDGRVWAWGYGVDGNLRNGKTGGAGDHRDVGQAFDERRLGGADPVRHRPHV